MRDACNSVCMLSVLVALTGCAGDAAAQAPATAGQRPNVLVLKDLPESQLFPVMNVMAQSLGVRCDYCHVRVNPDPSKTWSLAGGWQWERDDKPAKIRARQMIAMVLDVNRTQFGGTARVTCHTCHQGTLHPASALPLPPIEFGDDRTAKTTELPSADRVWDDYVKAVGGAAAANIASRAISGRDDRIEGRHGTFEILAKGADRYRFSLQMAPPDGPVVQTLTKEGGWIKTADTTRPLQPQEVERVRRAAMRFAVIKIDRPADMRISGVESIGSRRTFVATSDVNASVRRALYFDTVTGLLLRDVTTTTTMLLPLQEQVDYEDYRAVDGVTLPFVIRFSDGAPFSTSTRTLTEVRHNVTVDDAAFELPRQRP